MKRLKDMSGIVHFRGKDDRIALCGFLQFANILGQVGEMNTASEPVTCPDCATLYCRIKNAPWNEVDEKMMDAAVYAAERDDDDAGTPLQ